MSKLHVEAQTKPIYHDPWAKREAWRKHPIFSKTSNFRAMFPGLGIATVAFAAYCTYEHFFMDKKSHH
ncbi:NADH dehydrogenase 1 beta subcomplex subunit 3 [Mycotypha africana]|uniref:NADH dehydrogenase 1 beta subcomplex subunit 3 n=1 Tax=Mycotypha africana TaxID=64632 RepID=UPI002301C321|nr:NADH dehydrogenase 1 beta subcomplex subunit 3 [Mycotypha africana]KAI8981729.1 NADH dehydrogenase 1 beta subcomplex subunit 3 [Mycotypha africana]